jgi:glycosyltransferase involved in cell wall biosynthesis
MISFVVPAYNEELELPATLRAIRAAADFCREPYEIIVADDASSDSTASIAASSGATVVGINRRQIAAARNAGAHAARGAVFFFVDADTRITAAHISGALAALDAGYAGGGARVKTDGVIPLWARICVRAFCAVYFGLNLGPGAFLFTSRANFAATGGFDETLFVGEEIYFTMALKKLGRFKLLREPIITSGRKLRIYSARQILSRTFSIAFGGKRSAQSREKLDLWYDGRRESRSA